MRQPQLANTNPKVNDEPKIKNSLPCGTKEREGSVGNLTSSERGEGCKRREDDRIEVTRKRSKRKINKKHK